MSRRFFQPGRPYEFAFSAAGPMSLRAVPGIGQNLGPCLPRFRALRYLGPPSSPSLTLNPTLQPKKGLEFWQTALGRSPSVLGGGKAMSQKRGRLKPMVIRGIPPTWEPKALNPRPRTLNHILCPKPAKKVKKIIGTEPFLKYLFFSR